MNNLLPEEQDPQFEELITLLRQADLNPPLIDPSEHEQIISQARARLFPTEPEFSMFEDMPTSKMKVLGSFPMNPKGGLDKPRRGRRLPHLLNILAAALVVAALLGTSLLLFRQRPSSTGYRPVSATQTYSTATSLIIPPARGRGNANSYDSFVGKNGIMFGFDAQHTHFNPFEQMLNPATVGGLTKKWAYQTIGSVVSSPTVAGGVVYIGCVCGYVYALDATTGAKKWTYSTGGSQIADDPAVVGGVVYFGTVENHILYALDATTGAKKWSYQTSGSIISSPTVVGGVVYVGSDDNTLYALDAATGAKKWSYWTRGSIESSPAVAGGIVYVGCFDGNVYAFDAVTGVKKWAYKTGNNVYNSPAVAGGIVYVGAGDGNVYALDAITGVKKWDFRIGDLLGPLISSPAIADGVVYVASRANVYALDAATGVKKWLSPIQASTDPVLAGGLVYVGTSDGILYALDATTGEKKWADQGGGYSSPVVADGMIYSGSLAFYLPGT